MQPGVGVTLQLDSSSLDVVLHETTSQDLLLDLGPPLRKYWKEDDRMAKMWGSVANGKSAEGDEGSCQ